MLKDTDTDIVIPPGSLIVVVDGTVAVLVGVLVEDVEATVVLVLSDTLVVLEAVTKTLVVEGPDEEDGAVVVGVLVDAIIVLVTVTEPLVVGVLAEDDEVAVVRVLEDAVVETALGSEEVELVLDVIASPDDVLLEAPVVSVPVVLLLMVLVSTVLMLMGVLLVAVLVVFVGVVLLLAVLLVVVLLTVLLGVVKEAALLELEMLELLVDVDVALLAVTCELVGVVVVTLPLLVVVSKLPVLMILLDAEDSELLVRTAAVVEDPVVVVGEILVVVWEPVAIDEELLTPPVVVPELEDVDTDSLIVPVLDVVIVAVWAEGVLLTEEVDALVVEVLFCSWPGEDELFAAVEVEVPIRVELILVEVSEEMVDVTPVGDVEVPEVVGDDETSDVLDWFLLVGSVVEAALVFV